MTDRSRTDSDYLWDFVHAVHRSEHTEAHSEEEARTKGIGLFEDDRHDKFYEYGWVFDATWDDDGHLSGAEAIISGRGAVVHEAIAPYIIEGSYPNNIKITREDWCTPLIRGTDSTRLWVPLSAYIMILNSGKEGLTREQMVRYTSASASTMDRVIRILTAGSFIYSYNIPSALDGDDSIFYVASRQDNRAGVSIGDKLRGMDEGYADDFLVDILYGYLTAYSSIVLFAGAGLNPINVREHRDEAISLCNNVLALLEMMDDPRLSELDTYRDLLLDVEKASPDLWPLVSKHVERIGDPYTWEEARHEAMEEVGKVKSALETIHDFYDGTRGLDVTHFDLHARKRQHNG